MTSRDFCYWLQGYFELVGDKTDMSFSHGQVLMIANHLHMVFKHEIDPSMGDTKHQEELSKAHQGFKDLEAVLKTGALDAKINC